MSFHQNCFVSIENSWIQQELQNKTSCDYCCFTYLESNDACLCVCMCAPPPPIASLNPFISTSTSFAAYLGLVWVYEPVAGRSGQLALRISNHDTSLAQSKQLISFYCCTVCQPVNQPFNQAPVSESVSQRVCQWDAVICSIHLVFFCVLATRQLKQANSTQNLVAVPNLCTAVPSIFTVKTQKYVLVMGKSGNVRMCLFSEN